MWNYIHMSILRLLPWGTGSPSLRGFESPTSPLAPRAEKQRFLRVESAPPTVWAPHCPQRCLGVKEIRASCCGQGCPRVGAAVMASEGGSSTDSVRRVACRERPACVPPLLAVETLKRRGAAARRGQPSATDMMLKVTRPPLRQQPSTWTAWPPASRTAELANGGWRGPIPGAHIPHSHVANGTGFVAHRSSLWHTGTHHGVRCGIARSRIECSRGPRRFLREDAMSWIAKG